MQGRPVSASQLEKLALCRPGLVATREAYERQIETREPGFLIRKAQLEATPGLLPPRPLSGPQEREGAEARVIAGVSLGFHLQIDTAAMEAALGGWDEGTPCVLRVEFSAGSSGKAHLLQGMFPSSGRGMGFNDFLCRSCDTLQETIAPFLEQGCLSLKVRVSAYA